MPRVSIGLPVYNGEQYLRTALDSILAQTFRDIEVIISDNGSTDNTESICREYAERNQCIRYYRQPHNRGVSWNFNRVFALSNGEYFKWAAHDDALAPGFIGTCVEVLDRYPSVVIAYPRTIRIDEAGSEVARYSVHLRTDAATAPSRFRELLLVQHACYQGCGLIRACALRQTPLIANYDGSDRVLLAWLGLLGPFYEIPDYLFYSRWYRQQATKMDLRRRAAWFDPSKKSRIVLPNWRYFGEHFRCAMNVPLSVADRRHCCLVALRWPLHNGNGHEMVMDLYHAAKTAVHMMVSAGIAYSTGVRTSRHQCSNSCVSTKNHSANESSEDHTSGWEHGSR